MNETTAMIQPQGLPRVMPTRQAFPHFPGATDVDLTRHKKSVLLTPCDETRGGAIACAQLPSARTGRNGDSLVAIKEGACAIRIRTFVTSDSVP